MDFEQWKLWKEFEKQTGTKGFYEELKFATAVCFAMAALVLALAAASLFVF